MSVCEGCGAEITWATHERTGSPMPLDAEPTPDGLWEIEDGKARYRLQGSLLDAPLYKSHWATCPDADRFRGRAKA